MKPSHTNIIIVNCSNKTLSFNGLLLKCAIGKQGATTAKIEGDYKTPLGTFALRKLFWRSDKLKEIAHNFTQSSIITKQMGWCDAPEAPQYNQLITLPFAKSHEELWRSDGRYDIIIPLGYNDEPTIGGLGSAIFFHIAENDNDLEYAPTAGCIAISLTDMLNLLPQLNQQTFMKITM